MPVEYKVPGVYIEEIPSGSRPIQGVGTAMPAFIGFTYTRPEGNTGQPVFVASWNQFVEYFGTRRRVGADGKEIIDMNPFVPGFYLPYAVYGYFLNGGQSCYVQSLATVEDADRAAASMVSLTTLPAVSGAKALELRSRLQGPNAKQITVRIEDAPVEPPPAEQPKGEAAQEGAEPAAAAQSAAPSSDQFKLTITGPDQVEEMYTNLTMGRSSKGARNVVEALRDSKLVQVAELDASGSAAERRPKNGVYQLAPVYTQPIATADTFKGDVTERTGLGAFEEIPEITMMVCPDLMAVYERSRRTADDLAVLAGLQKELLAHCANMKDRFAILDAPPGMTVSEIRDYRINIAKFDTDTGKYGALYYPWIQVVNPASSNGNGASRIISLPPSGHIAGIYARVDQERGVHKAPANEAIRGAVRLERRLIDSEQRELNPIGVNCIREFPGRGILVWGARTLAEESSEWRYINVRRLFNFIEESIYEGTQWVVFEPNDMDLWERVKRTITAFLTRVWRDGALFGATPEEAFYVKCDAELNPPEVRDAGQLIVEVGIAPVKPAEFVVFRFRQMSGGGEVTE